MKNLGLLSILSLCASLAGCATGPKQISPSDVQRLSAMRPVAVVYVEPEADLFGVPSGQGGGEFGALMAKHRFDAQLQPYQGRVQQLGVADREYAAVHDALSSLPWLKDATWTRIRKTDADFNEFNFQLATSEKAVGRVVIVIEAGLSLQSYVDQLNAYVYIDVYTKKVATSTDRPPHFQGDLLDGKAGLGNPDYRTGAKGLPPDDPDIQARLDRLFAGESPPFLIGLDRALAPLKKQLTYYFSGVETVH